MHDSMSYEATNDDGVVSVIQHVDPSDEGNDFDEDPALPVLRLSEDQARAYVEAINGVLE